MPSSQHVPFHWLRKCIKYIYYIRNFFICLNLIYILRFICSFPFGLGSIQQQLPPTSLGGPASFTAATTAEVAVAAVAVAISRVKPIRHGWYRAPGATKASTRSIVGIVKSYKNWWRRPAGLIATFNRPRQMPKDPRHPIKEPVRSQVRTHRPIVLFHPFHFRFL